MDPHSTANSIAFHPPAVVVLGGFALVLALIGVSVCSGIQITGIRKAISSLGRQHTTLQSELNRKLELDDLLGSPAHRELIQNELSFGK